MEYPLSLVILPQHFTNLDGDVGFGDLPDYQSLYKRRVVWDVEEEGLDGGRRIQMDDIKQANRVKIVCCLFSQM